MGITVGDLKLLQTTQEAILERDEMRLPDEQHSPLVNETPNFGLLHLQLEIVLAFEQQRLELMKLLPPKCTFSCCCCSGTRLLEPTKAFANTSLARQIDLQKLQCTSQSGAIPSDMLLYFSL